MSCLSVLLIYRPRITLLYHFPNDSPSLESDAFLFVPLFSFYWFNSSANFAAVLNVELIFGWFLSWLLTTFKTWSSANCVFRNSAILNISALYVASICNRPLPPSLLSPYSPSISAFGWWILYTFSIFLVFLSIFRIYSNLQLIIKKFYFNQLVFWSSKFLHCVGPFIRIFISKSYYYYYYYYCSSSSSSSSSCCCCCCYETFL